MDDPQVANRRLDHGMTIQDNPLPQHNLNMANPSNVNVIHMTSHILEEPIHIMNESILVIQYQLEYDDIFDEDYRQYISPWDGKTKIKIQPTVVGLLPQ